MLENIQLENFKASKNIDVRLAPLSVLSGLNGSGKSTLLQAIAVLRQSYENSSAPRALSLMGSLVSLGKYQDVFSEYAESSGITLSVKEDGIDYLWKCYGNIDEYYLLFDPSPETCPNFIAAKDFQFLPANRIVPENHYPQNSQEIKHGDFLGIRGEYTADFLSRFGDKGISENRLCLSTGLGVDPDLLNKAAPTKKLLDQVAGWLQQLSPGARLSAKRLGGTDDVLLQYSYLGKHRDVGTKFYRPTHVGFGLTYCLPIIVACLAAPSGSLLLLENPEAHLHPQGQAALGTLLAKCANDGVQIIVETHSDHLLNGIRLAVRQNILQSEKVVIHYFTRQVDTGEVSVQSPAMLSSGRLSDWPEGFFDQWDKSTDSLLG